MDSAPSFERAANRRQAARACGLDPDNWYPVEFERRVLRGTVVPVRFWDRSFALFRTTEGEFHVVEDRCAHRQLKLSLGEVRGCRLTCPYHGWEYAGDGRLAHVPHDLCGHSLPKVRIEALPVRVRYGLVWVFPGDAARAAARSIPDIPELEGSSPWACVPLDFTWRAHHSTIIENVSDFTHAHLHRKYRPFVDATLVRADLLGDKVFIGYRAKIGQGRLTRLFVDRRGSDTNSIDLCFDYPYQWSNTGNLVKHWLFVLPIDAQTSRVFFLFYYRSLKVPLLPLLIPRSLQTAVLRAANVLHVSPLLRQDGMAVEAEQQAWQHHHDKPVVELNPAVQLMQQLMVRKWTEHLQRSARPAPLAATR